MAAVFADRAHSCAWRRTLLHHNSTRKACVRLDCLDDWSKQTNWSDLNAVDRCNCCLPFTMLFKLCSSSSMLASCGVNDARQNKSSVGLLKGGNRHDDQGPFKGSSWQEALRRPQSEVRPSTEIRSSYFPSKEVFAFTTLVQ